VITALYAPDTTTMGDAIGVFETMTMTATIEGADTMLKAADISIVELRLGKGLAGKSYVIVTGSVQNVRTAIDAALEGVEDRGVLISSVVIPSINPDLIRHLV
jgi:microcompartment protein CcmL/EutN